MSTELFLQNFRTAPRLSFQWRTLASGKYRKSQIIQLVVFADIIVDFILYFLSVCLSLFFAYKKLCVWLSKLLRKHIIIKVASFQKSKLFSPKSKMGNQNSSTCIQIQKYVLKVFAISFSNLPTTISLPQPPKNRQIIGSKFYVAFHSPYFYYM